MIIEPQNAHLKFPKKVDNKLNHEIVFIIKHNEPLSLYTIKNKISGLLSMSQTKMFLNCYKS